MKKTNIVRKVLTVAGVLTALLPAVAFGQDSIRFPSVKPSINATAAFSKMLIESLNARIDELEGQNEALSGQVEDLSKLVDECEGQEKTAEQRIRQWR